MRLACPPLGGPLGVVRQQLLKEVTKPERELRQDQVAKQRCARIATNSEGDAPAAGMRTRQI
jgi:hypothetical protein